MDEAHRQQHELGRHLALGAGDRLEALGPRVVQLLDRAVAGEVRGDHRVVLLAAADLGRLLHRVAAAALGRPQRPRGLLVGPLVGRLGQDLELHDAAGPLADRVAHAVRAGVAAADDHDVLALGGDRAGRAAVGGHGAVAHVEVVHRVVHAVELAPGDRQVARDPRAGGDDDRVVLLAQLLVGDVDADVDAAAQLDALGHELLHATLDDPLLDLEVGHAEAHQPAGRLVALVEHDRVARAAQLLRGGHARRAAADDGHRAAGLDLRRLGHDPALRPRAVDDRVLDLLDRDRVALADLEHARRLAGRG